MEARPYPLSSRAKPRDLRFSPAAALKMNCHPDRSEAEWRDLLFSLSESNLDGNAPHFIATLPAHAVPSLNWICINEPHPPAIFTLRLFLSGDLLSAASLLADLPCSHHRPPGHIAGLLAGVAHMACSDHRPGVLRPPTLLQ
jgi:hypothetical protein